MAIARGQRRVPGKRSPIPSVDWTLAAVALVVVGLSLALMAVSDAQSHPYQLRWVRCIDRLADGTIYGGQPECEQPPIVFAVGLMIYQISRDSLQLLSGILLFLVDAASLYILLRLVGSRNPIILLSVALAFSFTVLPMTLDCLASALSLLFAMLALWVFSDMGGKYDLLKVSALLMLALLSKVTVLSLIAGLAFAVCLPDLLRAFSKGWNRPQFTAGAVYGMARKVFTLAVFPLLSVLLAVRAYPLIILYTVRSHTAVNKYDYAEALSALSKTSPLQDAGLLLFLLLMALSALYLLRTKDSIAAVFVVAYASSFFSKYQAHGWTHNIFTSYYLIFPMLLLLLMAGRAMALLKGGKALLAAASLCVITGFLFGGYHLANGPTPGEFAAAHTQAYAQQSAEADRLSPRVDSLRHAINGFYSLIPKNTGRVLVNWEIYDILQNQTTNLDMGLVDNRNFRAGDYRDYPDDYGRGLVKLNVSSANFFEPGKDELELAREIDSGKYEMILIGPEARASHIGLALLNVSNATSSRYCFVYLPSFSTLKNIRHWSSVQMSDRSQCQKLMADSIAYSLRIFNDTCMTDEWAANYLLADILAKNNVRYSGDAQSHPSNLGLKCRSGADVIDRYMAPQSTLKIQGSLEVLFLAVVLVAAICVFAASRRGKHSRQRR